MRQQLLCHSRGGVTVGSLWERTPGESVGTARYQLTWMKLGSVRVSDRSYVT